MELGARREGRWLGCCWCKVGKAAGGTLASGCTTGWVAESPSDTEPGLGPALGTRGPGVDSVPRALTRSSERTPGLRCASGSHTREMRFLVGKLQVSTQEGLGDSEVAGQAVTGLEG